MDDLGACTLENVLTFEWFCHIATGYRFSNIILPDGKDFCLDFPIIGVAFTCEYTLSISIE